MNPDLAGAHFGLGRALREQKKKPRDAIACFREVIRLNADDASAHDALDWTLIELEQPADAEAAFRESVRLAPELATPSSIRKFAEAETVLREAIRLDPKHPYALGLLARALAKQGKQSEADELLKNQPK